MALLMLMLLLLMLLLLLLLLLLRGATRRWSWRSACIFTSGTGLLASAMASWQAA
jgi:hypothetical protein